MISFYEAVGEEKEGYAFTNERHFCWTNIHFLMLKGRYKYTMK